jgi:hypothetical protein
VRLGGMLPMNIFLRQEIDRMQKILTLVRRTLSDLKGQSHECLFLYIFLGTNGVLLYLEGKVQRKHFYKNRSKNSSSVPIPDYQWRDRCSRLRNRFCKSRETSPCFPCRFKNGGSVRRNRKFSRFQILLLICAV